MFEPIKEFYKKNYTKLLIVPLFFTLFSFLIISSTFISTGEFVARDIELKGGISSTLDWEKETTPDIDLLESSLSSTLSSTVNVRTINEYGSDKTIAIAFETESEVGIEQFQSAIEAELISQGFDLEITPSSYSTQVVGPSMGQAFLNTAVRALLAGFVLMSLIIFFSFKHKTASVLIILSAILDVAGAIAGMNLLGIKLSPSTIAALLMILGYSVDSNILITTSILKRGGKDAFAQAFNSAKTGLTMVSTTVAALLVLGFVSNSPMLTNMAKVLLIGLLFDISNTWFANMGILIWSEEKNGKANA